MIASLRRFDKSEVAKERMKIINFYNQYGEEAVKEAFGADRKVVSRWRKRLYDSNGKLSSLIPFSTRPINVRVPEERSEITILLNLKERLTTKLEKKNWKFFLTNTAEKKEYREYQHQPLVILLKDIISFFRKKEECIITQPQNGHKIKQERQRD